jgi:ariadne-1
MHMTCSQCKHEFCWMCLGAWATHGERTGGYYACNRYERAKSSGAPTFSEEEKKRAAAKHSLERYTHYYERWAAHGGSQRKAVADRDEWETRKLRRLGDRQNTPPSQLRFIVDALAQIAECRRVLKWTYGFGYYHFEGGESAKKRFFEFAQADAEETLEHLTEAVETELETFLTETRDAAEFGAFRGKLAGLTDITHKYFDTLVVEIERGFPSVAEETETPGEPAESDRDETRRGSETTATRGPDGVIRRISRGIREAVIGNGESVASRTRSRAPDP